MKFTSAVTILAATIALAPSSAASSAESRRDNLHGRISRLRRKTAESSGVDAVRSNAPASSMSLPSIAKPKSMPYSSMSFDDVGYGPSMAPRASKSRKSGKTSQPSSEPSIQPSISSHPSNEPSSLPSVGPSSHPTSPPSTQPSTRPSVQPSNEPSPSPSVSPSSHPTSPPSAQPSTRPSVQPSEMPSDTPSAAPPVYCPAPVPQLPLQQIPEDPPSSSLVVTTEDAAIDTTGGTPPKQRKLALASWGPVPASVIIQHNGLDWVWASPCLAGGCDAQINIGQDGFFYATPEQWALRPTKDAFGTRFDFKCASRYFSYSWNTCNWGDAEIGNVFSEPCCAGGIHPNSDTWLVRDPRCI